MTTNPILVQDEIFPLDAIKKTIVDMQLYAENLDVTCEIGFKKITSIYAEAKKWEKTVDEQRKAANEPDQSRINARNDRAKDITEPLKTILTICKRKADSYSKHIEELKRKEEEKITSAALLFTEDVPYIAPLAPTMRGQGATATVREETRFRVVDQNLVPRKYLVIDEQRIKQDIKLGVAVIPGVEIYTEKTTNLRVRI
jgi:hypothetical protein